LRVVCLPREASRERLRHEDNAEMVIGDIRGDWVT
jgi:hypothetical protein